MEWHDCGFVIPSLHHKYKHAPSKSNVCAVYPLLAMESVLLLLMGHRSLVLLPALLRKLIRNTEWCLFCKWMYGCVGAELRACSDIAVWPYVCTVCLLDFEPCGLHAEVCLEVSAALRSSKTSAFSLAEYFLNSANSHQEAVEQTIMALQMDDDSDVKYFASIHPASTKIADDAMSTASSTYWKSPECCCN